MLITLFPYLDQIRINILYLQIIRQGTASEVNL